MDLRHFRYFRAVAEQGGFTKAAVVLHVSQPTLSQQIRDLEREVGATLLSRGPDGVRLTAAGEAFYCRTGDVLAMVGEAAAEARRIGQEAEVVHIGWLVPLSLPIHVPIASAFAAAHPRTRLVWHELGLPEVERPLLDWSLDVAFVRLPLDAERLVWEALVEESCGLAVPPRHRLSGLDVIDVAEVLEEPMPLVGDAVSDRMKAWWLLHGLRNDEPPRTVGHPANTAMELALSVMLNTVVCPAPYVFVKTGGANGFGAAVLRGGPDASTGVARRRDDPRELPREFCEMARRVVRSIRVDAAGQQL